MTRFYSEDVMRISENSKENLFSCLAILTTRLLLSQQYAHLLPVNSVSFCVDSAVLSLFTATVNTTSSPVHCLYLISKFLAFITDSTISRHLLWPYLCGSFDLALVLTTHMFFDAFSRMFYFLFIPNYQASLLDIEFYTNTVLKEEIFIFQKLYFHYLSKILGISIITLNIFKCIRWHY